MDDSAVFFVTMFNYFDMTYQNKHLVHTIGRSKKIINLLALLIQNRGKMLSQAEIIANVWSGSDDSASANSLKNLVYRLRKVLVTDSGFPDLDYIIYCNDTYIWNGEINVITDTDEFLKYQTKIKDLSLNSAERAEYLKKATDLYTGRFLNLLAGEDWVKPLNEYFHNIFTEMLDQLIILNEEKELFVSNIELCNKALMFDSFDEKIHLLLIKAYVRVGFVSKAISHYNYVSDLLLNELGVHPSGELVSAYKNIISDTGSHTADLESIKNELQETSKIKGSYFCDYNTFKHIYRIEARSAVRNAAPTFLALITLVHLDNTRNERIIIKNVQTLQNSISLCVRGGDVFARYSKSQFVMMIKSITYENCEAVLKRVATDFYRNNTDRSNIKIEYKFQSLSPVNTE